MLNYDRNLKPLATKLRRNLTDAERKLWLKVRGKQILGVQFYRQRPIGRYIVDFYAPKALLVIELDGSQHFSDDGQHQDKVRDDFLRNQGLLVLRFNNNQMLLQSDGVLEVIFETIKARTKNPPNPLFQRGN